MSEYIVRETGYPGAIQQEIVGELVRCKDCRWHEVSKLKQDGTDDKRCKPDLCVLYNRRAPEDYYCADGEKGADDELTAED